MHHFCRYFTMAWHGFIFLLSFQAFIDSRKLQNRTAKTLWKGRSFWFVCNKEILSKQAKLHQHRVLSGFACTLAFNCKFLRFLVPRWCTNKRFDDFFVRFKTQFLAYIFGLKWFCVHACLQLQAFEVFSAALIRKDAFWRVFCLFWNTILAYCNVSSSKTSRLKAHAGFFRLLHLNCSIIESLDFIQIMVGDVNENYWVVVSTTIIQFHLQS